MESGIHKKLNVLIISSGMPTDHSPKMVIDMCKSLGEEHNVDLLLKYPMKSDISILSVYNRYEFFIIRKAQFFIRVVKFFKRNFFRLFKKTKKNTEVPEYFFHGIDDENPPISSTKILKKIEKDYDFVLVFFWHGMITAKTLFDIYAKMNKPILLWAADMFPMTGGCSYFWDCDRLEKSCGKCPGLNSSDENDVTHKNFLYKKSVLEKINCIFMGNNWMNNYARKSGMFKNIGEIYPIIDETIFKPQNKEFLKEQKNYSDKTILFFGAVNANENRKGSMYLVEALQLLALKRPDLVNKIVLLVAGNENDIPGLMNFNVHKTGYLTFEQLAECYAMADVFLSPSIQDAGPMMLNQALLCGTPAVAFEIGTACDVLNSKTGYLAKYRDREDFCNGILSLIDKTKSDLDLMSIECRKQSLEKYSYKAFRKNVVGIYNNFK